MKYLSILVAIVICGCSTESTMIKLEKAKKEYNPYSLNLGVAFNDYVQCRHLDNGTEVGIIKTKDGNSIKYWFMSHHISGDEGGTLFEFADGDTRFMKGVFCCEVQLPDAQLSSADELKKFINENNGITP